MVFFVGEERTFTGPAIDSEEHPIVSWEWDFGDGATGSGQIATHTYTIAGTYTPILVTKNDCYVPGEEGGICTYEHEPIVIEPTPECYQEFAVYNKQGLPIEDGWLLVVNIYDAAKETLLEERTAPITNGIATISVPSEDKYILAWAEKGTDQTASAGFSAGFLCTVDPRSLYQLITCDETTEHFVSGRAVLEHYDADGDGILSRGEVIEAVQDSIDGTINIAEGVFVTECWETYNGIINDMCPLICPTPSCTFTVT